MDSYSKRLAFILLVISMFTSALSGQTYFRPKSQAHQKPQAHARSASGGPVAVNAASFEPGISPGGLATIFGNDLTSVTGVVVAGTDPLPFTLAGVRVLVSGIPAPIFAVGFVDGQDQIN